MRTPCTRFHAHRAVVAVLLLAVATACSDQKQATPTTAASPAESPMPEAASPYDALPEAVRVVLDKPFTGDFDELVKRRSIRAGVTFNRTHYFIDKGQERGLAYESLKLFENDLNTELKTGNAQGARGDGAHATRSALRRPDQRQGGHGRGHGDRHARAGEARRLLGSDAHQRERSGGHRARSAAHRHGGRSGRPGGVRPQGQHLRREPGPAEQPTEGEGQAGGSHQRGPRRARRRRRARDGQRRPGPDYRRGRLSGRVLEPGVHRHQGAQGRHRAVRRQPGRRVSQGEPPAPGGRQHLAPEARKGRRIPEHGRTPLSRQRQVREERRRRERAHEAAGGGRPLQEVWESSTTSITC